MLLEKEKYHEMVNHLAESLHLYLDEAARKGGITKKTMPVDVLSAGLRLYVAAMLRRASKDEMERIMRRAPITIAKDPAKVLLDTECGLLMSVAADHPEFLSGVELLVRYGDDNDVHQVFPDKSTSSISRLDVKKMD